MTVARTTHFNRSSSAATLSPAAPPSTHLPATIPRRPRQPPDRYATPLSLAFAFRRRLLSTIEFKAGEQCTRVPQWHPPGAGGRRDGRGRWGGTPRARLGRG